MTLLLELKPETEEALKKKAALAGISMSALVQEIVETAATHDGQNPDMVEHLRAIGVLGAVKGKRRADGKSWSEIEEACDAH